MAFTFSEQGKKKILDGLLAMENSPFYTDPDTGLRVRFDDLRVGVTDDGRLSLEVAYMGKSILTMFFDMPRGHQRLSILADGNMQVSVDAA